MSTAKYLLSICVIIINYAFWNVEAQQYVLERGVENYPDYDGRGRLYSAIAPSPIYVQGAREEGLTEFVQVPNDEILDDGGYASYSRHFAPSQFAGGDSAQYVGGRPVQLVGSGRPSQYGGLPLILGGRPSQYTGSESKVFVVNSGEPNLYVVGNPGNAPQQYVVSNPGNAPHQYAVGGSKQYVVSGPSKHYAGGHHSLLGDDGFDHFVADEIAADFGKIGSGSGSGSGSGFGQLDSGYGFGQLGSGSGFGQSGSHGFGGDGGFGQSGSHGFGGDGGFGDFGQFGGHGGGDFGQFGDHDGGDFGQFGGRGGGEFDQLYNF